MNTQSAIAIGKSLHDLNVKALCQLNLSDLKAQLETLAHPSQRTKINRAIADAEFRIKEIEYMETLSVGQWVGSDMAAKPGQITNLGYAGQIPEAMVQWWGASVAIPERPLNLTVLSDDQMLYCWNHDKFPKLVRRFDSLECKDVEVLQEKLQEAAYYLADAKESNRPELERDYQLQVTYCNKRIAYLTIKADVLKDTASHMEHAPCDGAFPSAQTRGRVLISDIKRNGGTQQRTNLNQEVVIEYGEAMRQGDKFPPVKLTYDGTSYWLTDGFHTTEAAWSIGETDIDAIITKGSQRDAILASVGVNSDHGLRRSNADKRRAVTTLLEDEEWGKWSNRKVAKHCKVTEGLVRKIKKEVEQMYGCVLYAPEQNSTAFKRSNNPKSDNKIITEEFLSDNPKKYKDKYGNVSEMNTANIGSDSTKNLLTAARFGGSAFEWEASHSKRDPCESSYPKAAAINADGNNKLIEQFEIGQLVKLQLSHFDGASSSLKLANHCYGQITALAENKCSFNVKIFGHKSFVVSPQDIQPVDFVRLCVEFTPKQFIALMSIHQTRGCLEDALKKGVLGN
ncbi:MAG: hypothetical protein RLZZ574_474 [Cyanobacteriota bacterium]|jgi:hypothetical protein